jgi:hypothetical protein
MVLIKFKIFIYNIRMAKSDNCVYLTLPKGVYPPMGYTKSKNVGSDILYKKKISVDMFSALDMQQMIKRNISSKKGGKKNKAKKTRKSRK